MANTDSQDWVDEYIDSNIRNLVRALNEVAGLRTLSSCGGHPSPDTSQQPAGTFEVNLCVHRSSAGFRALEILTYAMREVEALSAESPCPHGRKPRLNHKVKVSAKEKHKAALSSLAVADICCFIGGQGTLAPQRDTTRGANSASFVQTKVCSATIK
jgi:hypothetical protein